MSDVKIGFVKLGNLGMSQVIDLILDANAWYRCKDGRGRSGRHRGFDQTLGP
jgi:hypothetical protein